MTTLSPLRKAVVGGLALALLTLTTGAATAQAAPLDCTWKADVLERPGGAPVRLAGTDSKGGFSGNLSSTPSQVVTWAGGKATVHAIPPGFESAAANDQNSAGSIAGTASRPGQSDYAAFVLKGDTYRFLPTPAGYAYARATAINSRGDVVGMVASTNPYDELAVLWPAAGGSVLLNSDKESATVADIDDDGTVLLNGDGPYLWRDGVVTHLTKPGGLKYVRGAAIRAGKVVGQAADNGVGATGYLWPLPFEPQQLPESKGVLAVNSGTLSAGRVGDQQIGVPAVWRYTGNPERLPVPAGFSSAFATIVGENGEVAGEAGFSAPVVWRCGS